MKSLLSVITLLSLTAPLGGLESPVEAPSVKANKIPPKALKSLLRTPEEPLQVATGPKAEPVSILTTVSSPSQDRFLSVDNIQEEHVPFQIDHPDDAIIKALYAKVEKGKVSWKTLPEKHFKRYKAYSVMSAPPGDYLITIGGSELIRIVGKERDDQDFEDEDFNNDDEDFTPKPEPEPNKTKVKYAIWIYETQDSHLTPEATRVMKDLDTKKWLKEKGIGAFNFDKDQAAAKKYKAIIDKVPSLILIDETGKGYTVLDPPKTLQELQDQIKRYSL